MTSFHLEVIPSRPAGHQFDLFQGGLKDPNRFFQTLARLAALVGNEKVGIPQRIDTHRPDSLHMLTPELGWSRKNVKKSGRPRTGPGLRRYRPGIAARVELNDGKPLLMQSSLISGRILEARGPWKSIRQLVGSNSLGNQGVGHHTRQWGPLSHCPENNEFERRPAKGHERQR